MKLLIITLTIIFINSGVFAKNSGTIEDYYKFCKPYQVNGFSSKGLSNEQSNMSLICNNGLVTLMKKGILNCDILNYARKDDSIDDKQFNLLSTMIGNGFVKANPLITSFIKYAENNPEHWSKDITFATYHFLSRISPCKLHK